MPAVPDHDLQPFRSIPGPRRLSLLDVVRFQTEFDRDPIGAMRDMQARYGNLVRFECLLGSLVFAFGPEHNRVIHTETDRFQSRPFVLPGPRGSAQHNLRQSIFTVNGAKHQQLRHQLLPPFQKTALPVYHDEIVELTRQALTDWWPGQRRDLHRDMHLLVWSIVRRLLYGLEETSATAGLHHAMEEWMFSTFSPGVRSFPFNLPFTPYRRMLRKATKLQQHFVDLIRAKRAKGGNGNDALSALINFRPNGKPLPDEVLAGHALTLFLVAYETTGNTLTWTLFLLAQHPEVQHALLDELAPWHGEVPAHHELAQLPLLGRVLKESTRILPAVPYSRRRTSCDGPLGPYFLPQRTRVIFSHYITHHLPEIFPEPERFRPERWETIHPSPGEYLPFGAGVRTCLGAALSQAVIRVALAAILPAWRIEVVPHTQIDRRQGISLGPANGLPVILHPQDRRLHASPISGNIHEMVDLQSVSPAVSRLAA